MSEKFYTDDLERKFATIGELMRHTGLSKRTMEKWLKKLREKHKDQIDQLRRKRIPQEKRPQGRAPFEWDLEFVEQFIHDNRSGTGSKPGPLKQMKFHDEVSYTKTDKEGRKMKISAQVKLMKPIEKLEMVKSICRMFETGVMDLDHSCRSHGIHIKDFFNIIMQDKNIYKVWDESKKVWLRHHAVTIENVFYQKLIDKLTVKQIKQVKRTYKFSADADGNRRRRLVSEIITEQDYIPDTATFMMAKKAFTEIAFMFPDDKAIGSVDIDEMSEEEMMMKLEELEREERELIEKFGK